MNGLVSYDSSSDEDGADSHAEGQKVGASPQSTASPVNGTARSAVVETTEIQSLGGAVAANYEGNALLGPQIPESIATVDEEESEQDIIRHLTQATHPMSAMPASPPGSPDLAASSRIQRFLELKARGVHFNQDLAIKSTFRNPSLLSTMMKRNDIEEDEQYATSLPTTLWNPSGFPEWAYKEGLLKIQRELGEKDEVTKKAQSAAGKRTIDFSPASKSGGSSRK